jgi:hypothetical protein
MDRRLLRQRILEVDDDGVAHARPDVGTRQHAVVGPDWSGDARRDLDGRNLRFEVELEDLGIRAQILRLRQRQVPVPSFRLRDVLCGQLLECGALNRRRPTKNSRHQQDDQRDSQECGTGHGLTSV